MKKENKNDKVIMIVNGEEIEMCTKTLTLSNRRMQKMLKMLKESSMETTHTLRVYWGDIIILNIITNQLLQKIDTRVLARIMRPTESIKQDLIDYRNERENAFNRLKDTIVKANDKDLPLDYSRELEKYFKEEQTTDEESTLLEEKKGVDGNATVKQLNTTMITTKNNENPPVTPTPKDETGVTKKTKADHAQTEVDSVAFHDTHNIYVQDFEEEKVEFSIAPEKENNSKQKNCKETASAPTQEQRKPPVNETSELEKNKKAFTSFGEINLDDLFK